MCNLTTKKDTATWGRKGKARFAERLGERTERQSKSPICNQLGTETL